MLDVRCSNLKPSFNIDDALGTALRHYKAGQLDKAEDIYRKILEINPNHSDSLHFLGFIAYQTGKDDAATDFIRKAIQTNPLSAVYHNTLGAVLKRQGNFDEAVESYQKAVKINPNYGEAYYNMGNALNLRGRTEEAVTAYRKVLAINPKNPEAYNNLGASLKDQGKLEEAIECYKKALEIRPNYAESYNNMGAALKNQGKLEEAIDCYNKALAINPNNAEAHYNLGNALKTQGKLGEAIECYEKSLSLRPSNSEAYNNMGNAFKDQGRLDEAVLSCRKAVEIDPRNAEAHNSMGVALNDQGKTREAAACYHSALANNPEYPEAHNNIGNVLKDQGRLNEAIGYYKKALAIRPTYYQGHSNLLFTYQYGDARIFGPDYSAEWLFEQHRLWDEKYAKALSENIQPHSNDRTQNRRLRVGYVSPDFHRHSCAYFILPLFKGHDKTQVEIFCYTDVKKTDEVTEELKQLADHWYPTVGKSHDQVAEQIRQDGIDILVDLAGHSANDHLLIFARKPAPIQVTWLGYPDTTGMTAMDYRLTDAAADPEGVDRYFSETLIRLSNGFLCYSPLSSTPEVGELPALKNNQIVFASFNNSTKVTENVVATWSQILKQVPGSHLLLKSKQLGDESAQRRYFEIFAGNGVPADRVTIMSHVSSRQSHLDLYNQIDIALDPFPYNGTTTSCEALWMGVPIITLCGERHVSRVGTSILSRLGLTELIAENESDYIGKAVQLAGDMERLRELRASLRQRMQDSPLCDENGFARSVETAYREMWVKGKGERVKEEEGDRGQFPVSKDAESHYKMGNALRDQGRSEEAIECYKNAVELNPNYAEAYNNMGNMFKECSNTGEAIACYGKAIEINPKYVQAYNNLGIVLEAQERIDEAIVFYREALKIDPRYAQAYSNLVPQLQQTCDWKEYGELTSKLDALTDIALENGAKAVEDPFTSLTRCADPARNFAIAASWVKAVINPISSLRMNFSFDERITSESKITVGYLSKDFRNHPVSHLMLNVFGLHRRDEFNVFCYSYGQDDKSGYRERITQDCDKFTDIRRMGHADAAKCIYADGVDILIDLMGFTGGSRLGICALRPAPIQATYLGFPGTTGADFFDYIITDSIVTPENHAAYYSEKFVCMPHCFQVNDNTQAISDKEWKPADFGLPQDGFVFCSFNQAYKIEPVMFDVWMDILRQVPGSILWLAHASETVKRNLRLEAHARGVMPERLVFAERLPLKADHLARHRLADLALDTRIYNGHTTTTDALWAGVPMITLQGGHYASRASSSILTAIGLPELIAQSPEAYKDLAVHLANHRDELETIRQKLAKNRTTAPLFDTQGFVRNLETAYKEMWKSFHAGKTGAD